MHHKVKCEIIYNTMETIDSAKLYNGNRPLISRTIFKGYLFILDITTFQKINIKDFLNITKRFVQEGWYKSGFCYFVSITLNNVSNSTPRKGLASDIYLYDILYVYEDPNLHIMYFCDVLNYLYVMRVWAYSAFLHIRNNSKTPKDLKVFQDKWFVYFSD